MTSDTTRRAENQAQIFLKLLAELRPHWRDAEALPPLPERIQRLLASDRRFGSRDRRLYRELIYTTLRYLPWVEPLLDGEPVRAAQRVAWLASDTADTAAYRAAILQNAAADAAAAGAAEKLPANTRELSVSDKARVLKANAEQLYPDWFWNECSSAYAPEELDALHRRAPLWLRLQGHSEGELAHALQDIEREFAERGWHLEQSEILPNAFRAPTDADVTNTESFRRGLFEVQDFGSQLVLGAQRIEPGGHWLDACAGAGGKTLQLAQILGPSGKVTAYDIRPDALAELRERAARARITNIEIIDAPPPLPPEGTFFDGVLVDAPCSGTGTWRRAPHLKWLTTHASVKAHAAQQVALLKQFSQYVRRGDGKSSDRVKGLTSDPALGELLKKYSCSGGRLIYATCSLCRRENELVVEAFQNACRDFLIEWVSHTIMPAKHDSDGFFFCTIRRR
ncbi:hypothetical protein AXK11_04460 [Cephaloticoccus primus]|uniref:SAM-dependent MTase RsmB/NOP-type domain-containing protein n=1 Tax=Cephaloticoccus primus TaxID=1548207 RepID=A0A139SPL7_9BACT|nr:RsmB/NOP family class I SAM-dependent RNA methyltransferase [Cephaloticoccus primus]KXU36496.1 hypothetical protein AXK11_04460 [Cephaloticoccus primus]